MIFYPGDMYWKDPIKILYINEGGLGIYGGIIGGLLGGIIMAKIHKMKIPAVLDIAVQGFLIGQGIGRWGNFINQEAFGTNTNLPWGMYSAKTESYLASQQASLEAAGISVDNRNPGASDLFIRILVVPAGSFGLVLVQQKVSEI